MLKRKIMKKMLVTSAVLFAFTLMYFIPNDEKINLKQELKYVNSDLNTSWVYLLDSHNMLGRTKVVISSKTKESIAKELIEVLIKEKNENKIPSGFKAILPSDTTINSITYKDGLIKIDFSEHLLDVSKEYETKVIESIIYTLTSIDEVDKVIIYLNGNILTKLPKSKINLPSTLDRSYGINKSYDITSYKDINSFNVYYISKYNDDIYYVPVTKYVNDSRDKVEIIVEQLSTSSYNQNLMSYLDCNTKLVKVDYITGGLDLTFNESIFSNTDTNDILDEVINAITLSVADSYDVEQVIFRYNNQEIYKSVIKMLE